MALFHYERKNVLKIQDFRFRVHVEQSADGRGLDLVFRSIQAPIS
jgi:hypothetical protein